MNIWKGEDEAEMIRKNVIKIFFKPGANLIKLLGAY